jgi:hypothetical protein
MARCPFCYGAHRVEDCLNIDPEQLATELRRRQRWTVESPDGLPIEPRRYRSEAGAREALRRWVLRFVAQGYYKDARGERIPLDALAARCTVTPVTPGH